MTDIPYSFVPGTKAKAQEVNANFIALANSIDSNQSSADSRVSAIEADISALQAKKYVDFNTFTGAILEAPEGVIENTSTSLTVKSGLRVVIPDGKNSDGTLKNIDFTLDDDIILDISNYNDGEKFLFLTSDGLLFTTDSKCYFISENTPSGSLSSEYMWFKPSDNILKRYNSISSSWDESKSLLLANIIVSSGQLTKVKMSDVLSFYKRADKREIIDYGCLSGHILDIAMGVSGSEYLAPANGILYWDGVAASNTSWFVMTNKSSSYQTKSLGLYANNTMNCHIRVAKYDTVKIDYSALLTANAFRFIYEKGELD